jgi:hypothetical protein
MTAHVEDRHLPLLRPDEPEKLLDDAGQALRLRYDDLHQPLLRGADGELARKDLDGAGDRSKRVADLVSNTGRELPDRRELLGKARSPLELLHFRQVLKENQPSS